MVVFSRVPWSLSRVAIMSWMSRWKEVDGSKVIGSVGYNPKQYPIDKYLKQAIDPNHSS